MPDEKNTPTDEVEGTHAHRTTSDTAEHEAPDRPVKSFTDVGVDPLLAEALAAKGIDAPFPIQELTLPIATKGHDVIGQARTGTGKTLAFALALLGRVTPGGGTQALVIVPTRELCLQVAEEMQIGAARGLRTIAVYGGVGYEEQEEAFREGHEVVVGTPGRLLDHLNKGNLRLDGVTELVLDEADEMLDMGFLPDVERLIEACNDDRHGMLFSATMPSEVVKLARRYLDHPTFMRADHEVVQTAPNVEQHFFQVHRMDKPRVLARILQSPDRGGVYVFVRTKHMADRLVRELEDLATPAIAIHGDLRQATREKNLDKFRDGSATVLVATEVAARGLDVENVTHVVNYDCPDDEKMYLHRIGRTARAGAKGVAVTFAEFNEVDRLNVIRKKLGAQDNPVVTIFSTSDELVERFDLPDERPWDAQVAATRAGTRTDRRDDGGDRGDRSRGKRGGGRGDDRGRGTRGNDRGRGDDRARERSASSDQRRKGSSDGTPKSSRASEGSGHDRDADRDRRDRQRGRREEPGGRERRNAESRAAAPREDERGTEPREDERGTERSGRGTDRSDGSTRTRTRTRARVRDRDVERTDGGRADGGRTDGGRADGGRADGGRADRDRDADARSRDRDAGGRSRNSERGGERSRSRTERDRSGDRDRDSDRNRDGDRERSGGRDRSGRDRSGDRERSNRGGSGRSKGDRGGRGGRDGGNRGNDRGGRGETRDATVRPARRGEEARGDGAPHLARRVKVEHLP